MAIHDLILPSALMALLLPLAMAAPTALPTIITVPYTEQPSYVMKQVLLRLPVDAPKDLVTVTAGTVDLLPRPEDAPPEDAFGDLYAIDKANLADFKFDVHVVEDGRDFTSHCHIESRQGAFVDDKLVQFDIRSSASFLSPCGYISDVRVVCGEPGSKENLEATCT